MLNFFLCYRQFILMKTQIQRIRKANFSDIERRVIENNVKLCEMEQKLTKCQSNQNLFPAKLDYSKFKHINNSISEIKSLLKLISEEMMSRKSGIIELSKTMGICLLEEIKKRDCIIQSLRKEEKTESGVQKKILKTKHCQAVNEKAFIRSRQQTQYFTHSGTLSTESFIPIRKNNSTMGLHPPETYYHSRPAPNSQLTLQNFFSSSSQQKTYACNSKDLSSVRKQQLNLQIDTDYQSAKILKKDIPVVDKQAIILSHCISERKPSFFGSTQNLNRKSRYVAPNVCIASLNQRGNREIGQISMNKENGPVLPKPLRKKSTESERNASQQRPPDIPLIKIPIFNKPPTDNGFGVLNSNGSEIYRGLWRNGLFDGRGKLKGNGWMYQGEFKGGVAQGSGSLLFGKDCKWIGKFSKNQPQGEGCLIYTGNTLSGIWRRGQLERKKNSSSFLI